MATQRKLVFRIGLTHDQQTAVVSGKGFRDELHDFHLLIGQGMRSILCLPSIPPQGNGHTFISFLRYFSLYFLKWPYETLWKPTVTLRPEDNVA